MALRYHQLPIGHPDRATLADLMDEKERKLSMLEGYDDEDQPILSLFEGFEEPPPTSTHLVLAAE
jgi:hypothetical protein